MIKFFQKKNRIVLTVVGLLIFAVLLYLVIPPKFTVVDKISPDEMVYDETELLIKTNKSFNFLPLDSPRLDEFIKEYIFRNYHLDTSIFYIQYKQTPNGYLAKLYPKFKNIHDECYMTEFYDKDMDIEDYADEFLIRSREKFLLDIKGEKRDFEEVLRTGVGIEYQFATIFWLLLQEKGIKSYIEYIDGVYYNVVDGKKFDIGRNIYH